MKRDIETIDFNKEQTLKLNRTKFKQSIYFKMLTVHLVGMLQGISIICMIVFYELDYLIIALVLVLVSYSLTPPINLLKRK